MDLLVALNADFVSSQIGLARNPTLSHIESILQI
jgi:hypothetical protein